MIDQCFIILKLFVPENNKRKQSKPVIKQEAGNNDQMEIHGLKVATIKQFVKVSKIQSMKNIFQKCFVSSSSHQTSDDTSFAPFYKRHINAYGLFLNLKIKTFSPEKCISRKRVL